MSEKRNASENQIERAEMETLLKSALDRLYRKDRYLISLNNPQEENGVGKLDKLHHVGERSIVFRVAHYVQNLILKDSRYKNHVVDCEYNRHVCEIKKTPNRRIYPDVILHERGTDANNLLVLEFKAYWNKEIPMTECARTTIQS